MGIVQFKSVDGAITLVEEIDLHQSERYVVLVFISINNAGSIIINKDQAGMLRVLMVLMIVLAFRADEQRQFDIQGFLAEPNNLRRTQLFDDYLDQRIEKAPCLSNLELINGYFGVLSESNLMFQDHVPILYQKLFLSELLKSKFFEKKWNNWDGSTKEYELCLAPDSEDIRSPMKTIDHRNHIVSMRGTFDRYPYLYFQVKSGSITYLMNLIPNQLKEELQMARIIIYNQKIYQQVYSKNKTIADFTQKLAEAGDKIPDMDFVLFLGETVTERQIHSYCQKQNWDIMTYDTKFELFKKVLIELPSFMWAKDLKNPLEFNKLLTIDNEVNNHAKWQEIYLSTIESTRQTQWDSKIQKAYFRGSLIGKSQEYVNVNKNLKKNFPRLELFNMSIHRPDIVDAKPYFNNKTIPDLFEQPSIQIIRQMVSKKQQLQWKYLLSMDGSTAPYGRLPWSLLSKSLVVRQQTSRIQWFFDHLKPYVHYVPMNQDLSDLEEIIQFAHQNDQMMQQIAQQGNTHAIDRFSSKRIFHDFCRIFQDYADIQKIYQSPPDLEKLIENGLQQVTTRKTQANEIIYLTKDSSFLKQVQDNVWSIIQTLTFFGSIALIALFKASKRYCKHQNTQPSYAKIFQTSSFIV